MINRFSSVTPLYAQALLQSAERHQYPLPKDLCAAVRSYERVPLEQQDRLWDAYCIASADPLAGLRLGLELQVGHLDSVGLLLVTCDTVGEALEQLIEVAPVVGEGGDFAIQREGELASVHYQPFLTVRGAERVEAVLASMLNLTRWSSGGSFSPRMLQFTHQPLGSLSDYQALLNCPVRFAAEVNALQFSATQLDLPLIQANSTLRDHLRQLADRTLAELGQNSLSAEVQRLVRAHPNWGKERVAEQLDLSGRHLNRKLAEEGLSFKTLRESVLQHLACQALQTERRVAEIAEQLGFSDENAFVRAFRRWQGVTPARYRDGL